MKLKVLICLPILGLITCDSSMTTMAPVLKTSMHPFHGCWENETGLEREVWIRDPSGWLVGYAASRNLTGEVTFFEHMRLETGLEETLVVTGPNGTPIKFARVETQDTLTLRFENLAHDFPQVIAYTRSGNRLDAWISNADGSQKIEFKKLRCKGS